MKQTYTTTKPLSTTINTNTTTSCTTTINTFFFFWAFQGKAEIQYLLDAILRPLHDPLQLQMIHGSRATPAEGEALGLADANYIITTPLPTAHSPPTISILLSYFFTLNN